MIRDYQPNDAAKILQILQQPGGHQITDPEAILNSLASNTVLVFDKGGVRGFSLIEVGKSVSQIILYTDPAQRCMGIGSALWEASLKSLNSVDPATIWVFYRQDIGSSRSFYASKGCQVWYAYHHMIYHGPAFEEPLLEWKLYEEPYFELYYQSRRDAFAPLMDGLGNDEPEDKKRENTWRWLNENRDHVYLFFDQGLFIGSLAVVDNLLLDELFVCPGQQGKGYGKDLVHFGINRILEKGHHPTLAVVASNTHAKHLYDRIGFELIQTLEMSRLIKK